MGEVSWLYVGGAIGLIVIGLAIVWLVREKQKGSKVVAMGKYKRRIARGQKCSLCKRKDKLQFYTMGSGQVTGVCRECRETAQRNNWERV